MLETKKVEVTKVAKVVGNNILYIPYEESEEKVCTIIVNCKNCGREMTEKTRVLASEHPSEADPVVFKCECGKIESYWAFFYVPQNLKAGKTNYLNGERWMQINVPVQIDCPHCGGKTLVQEIPCTRFDFVEIEARCSSCKRTLSATVHFFLG